jgi:ATP-dependent DNA ligase
MITPMLAASGPLHPDSAKWAYEVKWDGFRALVQASPAGITISSRNGYDMTSRSRELLKEQPSCERCAYVHIVGMHLLARQGAIRTLGFWRM